MPNNPSSRRASKPRPPPVSANKVLRGKALPNAVEDLTATGTESTQSGAGGGGGGGFGVTSLSAGLGIALTPSTITGAGSIAVVPFEVYLTSFATLALADAAAVALGAVLVLNTLTGTAVAVTTNTSVASPVRFASATFSISSGKVLTFAGGIVNAPLSQLFSGSGTVQLNAKTTLVWPEWWGAAGQVAGNDDSAGINAALLACYNGSPQDSATFTFANKTYYLQTNPVNVTNPVPILSMPGALLKPSTSSPASIGIVLGTAASGSINFEYEMRLPALNGFSSIGLQLKGCCLAKITIGLIQGCPDGIELYSDNVYGACLDNDITVAGGIYTAADGAIKVKTAGNAGTPGTIQGNNIYANFIEGCQRWVYFVNTASGGGHGAQNVNTFTAEAIDWNGVTSFIAVDNSAGAENTSNIFEVLGFFASGAAIPVAIGSYANGQFGVNCEFIGFPAPFTSWSQFGMTESAGDFGNRYDAGGIQSRNMADISAQTSANSRAGYNGGNPPGSIFNRVDVTMTLPGNLAAGATQDFYIYHMLALGSARLSFVARGMQGCLVNLLTDTSGTHANEIHIQVMNVSAALILSGVVLTGQVVIGIP